MRKPIVMPKMGQSMEEGTLVEWLKRVGDRVERGDVVASIETDKATVNAESFASGTICELLIAPGDTVPVGTPIAWVETG